MLVLMADVNVLHDVFLLIFIKNLALAFNFLSWIKLSNDLFFFCIYFMLDFYFLLQFL